MRCLVMFVCLAMAFAACDDSGSEPMGGEVVAAVLTPEDGVIKAPTMLTGQGVDANGVANTNAVVTWESLTPNIVTVDQTGTVTPVATGIGRVRITVEGFMAEATVRAVWNVTGAASLFPLFEFDGPTGPRRASSDASQADADARTAHADNVWAHLNTVLPLGGGATTQLFYTNWREIWVEAIPFCGGTDDVSLIAWSFCSNPNPRHFLLATDGDAPSTRALAQQRLRNNWSDADAFPWLKEGWSGWIAGGTFDSGGNLTLSGARQEILDAFDAADSGGNLETLFDLLHFGPADFYSGVAPRAPVDQMIAQVVMFWGWIVTENSSTAAAVFNEIEANAGGALSNDDLLAALFGELGMSDTQAESAYQTWARSQ